MWTCKREHHISFTWKKCAKKRANIALINYRWIRFTGHVHFLQSSLLHGSAHGYKVKINFTSCQSCTTEVLSFFFFSRCTTNKVETALDWTISVECPISPQADCYSCLTPQVSWSYSQSYVGRHNHPASGYGLLIRSYAWTFPDTSPKQRKVAIANAASTYAFKCDSEQREKAEASL